ncbi:MAG: CBS domain-containing protein, partial [Gammaproteobacteria bacterium]
DVIYEISHKGLGLTLVKNNKNKVTGIFTDGDLRRILNKKINIEDVQFKNYITRKFQFIDEDLQIGEAMNKMNKNKIYSLVVKNKKDIVIGILRMHDIVEAKII